jgi:hypothetical protein
MQLLGCIIRVYFSFINLARAARSYGDPRPLLPLLLKEICAHPMYLTLS